MEIELADNHSEVDANSLKPETEPVEVSPSSPSIWLICDGCGFVCVSIAYALLISANVVVLRLGQWPGGSLGNFIGILFYEVCFSLSICSHLSCMLTDPGACPKEVNQIDGEKFCNKCKAPKPARAHHCSTCQRCIMKMDHHCPWVNNCVAARNQKHFLLFLFYVQLQAWTAITSLSIYFLSTMNSKPGRPRPKGFLARDDAALETWREETRAYAEVTVAREGELLCCLLVFFVALIFGLFTCIMMCDQFSNISSNQTGIDSLQGNVGKARPWREAMQEVMGRGPSWRWLLPTPLRSAQGKCES